jgi:thioredoxin reductase
VHPRIEVVTGATVCLATPATAGAAARLFVERSGAPGTAGAPTDGAQTVGARAVEASIIEARTMVLATGASELSLPFPGWDLPGVLTPGGAQALLKAHGVLAGSRILVAGTGPFLWPVAAGLCRAGARVVAVVDAATLPGAGRRLAGLARHPALLGQAAGYLCVLAAARVPVLGGRAVVAAHGRDAVESVTVARLGGPDASGRGVREYAVDAVCVGWGFVPSVELARSIGCAEDRHPTRPGSAVAVDADQATSVPGVFAAGETTGIGGAAVSWWEGAIAGAAAARALGAAPSARSRAAQNWAARSWATQNPATQSWATQSRATPIRAARRRLRHARHAAGVLDRGFPLYQGWPDWLSADTVFCRCEEVTWQRIAAALDEGCVDLRTVKGQTRCGMGWCQGRVCGPAAQSAVALRLGRPPGEVGDLASRAIAAPVPIGLLSLADEV